MDANETPVNEFIFAYTGSTNLPTDSASGGLLTLGFMDGSSSSKLQFFSNTIMYLNVYNGITVGKIGKKSKRNKVLKSELGGLIGINDTWFRTRSIYKGSILEAPTGIYRPNSGVTDTLSGGGLILVFRMDNNNACVFQVTGDGALAVRTMNVNNGKWSEWDIIVNPSFPT